MKIEEHIQFWIESADNDLDTAQKLFEVSDFNLEVRYPEYKREFQKKCTSEFCDEKFIKIKEHYKWLKSQLKSGKS
jgi:formylmethanofuran dehydrogenase subunit E